MLPSPPPPLRFSYTHRLERDEMGKGAPLDMQCNDNAVQAGVDLGNRKFLRRMTKAAPLLHCLLFAVLTGGSPFTPPPPPHRL